jgi:hypothetical protein
MGLTWVYGTGNAITLTNECLDQSLVSFDYIYSKWTYGSYTTYEADYYNSINGFRMPAYHRLDIGVNWHKPVKRGLLTSGLGLYNAYNHKNPYYLYFEYGRNRDI